MNDGKLHWVPWFVFFIFLSLSTAPDRVPHPPCHLVDLVKAGRPDKPLRDQTVYYEDTRYPSRFYSTLVTTLILLCIPSQGSPCLRFCSHAHAPPPHPSCPLRHAIFASLPGLHNDLRLENGAWTGHTATAGQIDTIYLPRWCGFSSG